MSKPNAEELEAARQRGRAEAEQIIEVARAAEHSHARAVVEGQRDRLAADERRSLRVAEAAATTHELLDEWLTNHPEGN